MLSRQKGIDKIYFVDYYVYIANRKRGEKMAATIGKNDLKEQKNDVQEMATFLKKMSEEERKKIKYIMVGMQLVKDIEKAG
mgnify:CR=1 FL=1